MKDIFQESSGVSKPFWLDFPRTNMHAPLDKDCTADVAIVGGGIAGLSAALGLLTEGFSVVVLEDGLIGSGETGRTSGHLSSYVDGRVAHIKSLFGIDKAALAIKSHSDAIDSIERIAHEFGIDCDFKRVNGYLFSEDPDDHVLHSEFHVLQKIAVLKTQWIDHAPCTTFNSGRCIQFENQAQFHPIKYLYGLEDAILRRGGKIYEHTHVSAIDDGKPCVVTTVTGARVKAKHVVVATSSPINDRILLQTKLAQYRTYAIVLAIPKGVLKEALFWDTMTPYHYLRLLPTDDHYNDYVLIGGEDHKTGQKDNPREVFSALKQWAVKHFLRHEVVYHWSGQVVEPVDSLAYIGKNPGDDHVYVHTGTSGSGLTYGAIAGMLLPDLILGRPTPLEKLYCPARKTLKASGVFIKEACNMAAQYVDWIKPQDKGNEPSTNEGIVVRHGLSLQALYKDDAGTIHRMSALCPHLGGVVHWNSLEKTWDCPCHGSRFTATGKVINGPSNCDLKKI